ncbi:hypothetical protein DITRI_Ditri10aG0014800 [Diplodiscus trichospermus]
MEQSFDRHVSAEELEVANILLQLPHLNPIFESESRRRFSSTWGAKRRRSTAAKEQVVSAATSSSPALKLSPPPSPPRLLPINIAGSTSEAEAPIEKVLTSLSPATPLSFSPSESDEKPLPPKKKTSVNGLKKKKEQLLEMVNDFTMRNELLKRDIENKKRFYDQQKAENLELKAKKQKLSQSVGKEEEPCLETSKSLNLEIKLTQISTSVYHQPLKEDQTVYKLEMNKNYEYPFGGMISWLKSNTGGLSKLHDNVGPFGLLDLNVSPDEAHLGFISSVKTNDEETAAKARAAEARWKRMQICRSKNYNSARYPFR